MPRYIDAEIYEDKLAEYCKANCKYTEKEREYMCGACDVGNAIEMLDNTPTADVKETVHGEWVKYDEGDCTCLHCGFVLDDWTQAMFYSFCPNCGCDMRKGEKDDN